MRLLLMVIVLSLAGLASTQTNVLPDLPLDLSMSAKYEALTAIRTEALNAGVWSYYGIRFQRLALECAHTGMTDALKSEFEALKIEVDQLGVVVPRQVQSP